MSFLTKIVYISLFILLLIHPHFITGHVFSLSQAYAQSLTTLVLASIALMMYFLHIHEMKKREDEKKQIEDELNISSDKLIAAYKYIGLVNRRLPLLNNITTDLLKQSNNKRGKKDIFTDLLATSTVSLVNTSWGMFRFITVNDERTIKEFIHTVKNFILSKSKISNNKLLRLRTSSQQILKVNNLYVLATSDRRASIQCFFIFPKGKNNIKDKLSILQAIVDQAQLFYQYLYY